jgi:hypothetical protein
MSRATPLESVKLSKHSKTNGTVPSSSLPLSPKTHLPHELSKYDLVQQLPARSPIPKHALDIFRGPPDHSPLTFGSTNSLLQTNATAFTNDLKNISDVIET